MINREKELDTLRKNIKQHPVEGIVGARQVGKTTLARSFVARRSESSAFFDLESTEDLARLEDPMLALKGLRGLVVIHEV
jgi:predicted AAA+ superfamily ATPase